MKERQKKMITFLGPYVGLIFLTVVLTILTGGDVIAPGNLKLVMEQSIIMILSSAGLVFVMSMGMLDLSVGANICICCYMIAKVSQINLVLGLIAGLATGLLVGFINGILTGKYKIMSFLVTLCTRYIINGLMVPLIAKEAVTVPFSLYKFDTFEFKIILLVVVLGIAGFVYSYTPFGNRVRMIGSNETAAVYSCVEVNKIKIICYMICGFMGAIAAYLTAIRTGTAALNTGSDMMFNSLIALVMGGFPAKGGSKARFSACIIGSLVMAILTNGLTILGMNATVQQFLKGGIFLIIIGLLSEKQGTSFVIFRNLFRKQKTA